LIRKNTCVAAMEFSRCTRATLAKQRRTAPKGPVSQNSTACAQPLAAACQQA